MDRVAEQFWEEIMDRRFHLNPKGYAVLSGLRDCPLAYRNGQILRCRYVAWAFGLLRNPEDTVHHRDKDKLNDHPENFEILSRDAHSVLHASLMSQEHKDRIALSLKGHFVSALTRKRLSEAHKGIRLSPEAKAKLSAANKGREITWGNRISAALKGRAPSEACREAQRKAVTGKVQTAEHKAKAAVGRARRWASAREALNRRRDEWVSLRYLGATMTAIAKAYEVSVPTVSRVLGA